MDDSRLRVWLAALLDARCAFTVSLFGLAGRLRAPVGWKVRLDALADHLFYFVAEGALLAEIEGETRAVASGDLLWAARETPIDFRLDKTQNLVIWRFRLRALDIDSRPLAAPQRLWHVSPARGCETWMEQIVDEASLEAPFQNERMRALLLGLLTELARSRSVAQPVGNVLSRSQRARIAARLSESSRRWPSPADLAQVVELSPDYFTRCFSRTYGVSPRRWLLEERMRLAGVRLLESSATVSQIAGELGYEDIFSFSRQFKAVVGLSPTQYRQRHGTVATL